MSYTEKYRAGLKYDLQFTIATPVRPLFMNAYPLNKPFALRSKKQRPPRILQNHYPQILSLHSPNHATLGTFNAIYKYGQN